MKIFSIILLLIALFVYGGYKRQKAGEIDVVLYYNGTKVKLFCFLLIILAVILFII
jgi:hypothetical protein